MTTAMSDLRTRIAKVLHQRQATADAPEGWVWTWEQESKYEQRSWLEDADAVIAALNLTTPVKYLSVDESKQNYMIAGHYTQDVNHD
jgi:sarcosine oxidase gamma subunit